MEKENLVVIKISNLLKSSNKTQKELTDYLGITQNAFTDWKAGRLKSYQKYLYEIASFLGVSVAYLKGEEDMASPSQSKETQIKILEEDLRQAEFWDFDDEQYTLSLNRKKTAENLYDILSKRETRIIAPTVADDDYYKNAFFELGQTLAEKEDELKELKEKLREKGGI